GAHLGDTESSQSTQRSGGVRGQGFQRFTSQLSWWLSRSENPSPRLFRAEGVGADSLHAGLRAPEPTLSRGERVVPAPLHLSVPGLVSAHPPLLQRGWSTRMRPDNAGRAGEPRPRQSFALRPSPFALFLFVLLV